MTLLIAQIIFIGTAVALSILILLQQSKGAGMGASFGAGASGTVFGSRGSGSFLYKFTRVLALVFFVSALGMGYLQNKTESGLAGSVYSAQNQTQTEKTAAGVDASTSGKDNGAPASDTSIPLSGQQ